MATNAAVGDKGHGTAHADWGDFSRVVTQAQALLLQCRTALGQGKCRQRESITIVQFQPQVVPICHSEVALQGFGHYFVEAGAPLGIDYFVPADALAAGQVEALFAHHLGAFASGVVVDGIQAEGGQHGLVAHAAQVHVECQAERLHVPLARLFHGFMLRLRPFKQEEAFPSVEECIARGLSAKADGLQTLVQPISKNFRQPVALQGGPFGAHVALHAASAEQGHAPYTLLVLQGEGIGGRGGLQESACPKQQAGKEVFFHGREVVAQAVRA